RSRDASRQANRDGRTPERGSRARLGGSHRDLGSRAVREVDARGSRGHAGEPGEGVSEMTAGLWHQGTEVLDEGARETRPAVSSVWALGRDPKLPSAWLDVYDGPEGRSAVFALAGALGRSSLQRFEEALSQALGWGLASMVLDFSRVTHLDYRRLPK